MPPNFEHCRSRSSIYTCNTVFYTLPYVTLCKPQHLLLLAASSPQRCALLAERAPCVSHTVTRLHQLNLCLLCSINITVIYTTGTHGVTHITPAEFSLPMWRQQSRYLHYAHVPRTIRTACLQFAAYGNVRAVSRILLADSRYLQYRAVLVYRRPLFTSSYRIVYRRPLFTL